MRVIIVDDSIITREGLARMLEGSGIEVVGSSADGESVPELIGELSPDVAVLDIRMPPTHTDEGILLAQRIFEEHPEVAVLILSHHIDASFAMRLIEERPEGAGYLLKDRIVDPAILADALRRLTEGESVVDPTIVSRLLGRRRVDDPLKGLTEREREVLGLVAEGLSNRAIAARLHIVERTVEAHVTQTFLKLGLRDDPSSHRRVLAVLRFLRRDG